MEGERDRQGTVINDGTIVVQHLIGDQEIIKAAHALCDQTNCLERDMGTRGRGAKLKGDETSGAKDPLAVSCAGSKLCIGGIALNVLAGGPSCVHNTNGRPPIQEALRW